MIKPVLLATALCLSPLLIGCSGSVDNTANAETVAAISAKLPLLSGDHVWTVDRYKRT